MNIQLSILRFLNIIIVALLAGVSLGIWMGFNPAHLTSTTYVEQQQNMLGALRVVMVVLVFVATILTIVAAFVQRNHKVTFFMLLTASLFLIGCILITRFGNKPIDDIVMGWTIDSIPANWTEMRDDWWFLHKARTLTELIALCLITWTSIKRARD